MEEGADSMIVGTSHQAPIFKAIALTRKLRFHRRLRRGTTIHLADLRNYSRRSGRDNLELGAVGA